MEIGLNGKESNKKYCNRIMGNLIRTCVGANKIYVIR